MSDAIPKVSVIVPVYNVERYLDKCIKSIIGQSFIDFELLLIDDGSTDSSGDICEVYNTKDSRVRVFHKENGGLSDARNYGIDRAMGMFYTFIDSDDYIGSDYLKILVELVDKYEADISVIKSKNIYSDGTLEFGTPANDVRVFNTTDALSHMCRNTFFGISAWGKLYSKKLFEGIRYPKGKLYEDVLTTPYLFAKANRVVSCDAVQYYWLQRSESIMHRKISMEDFVLFDNMEKLINFIDQNYPDVHDAAICRFVNDSFWTIVQRLACSENYYEQIDFVINRCKKYWKEGLFNNYLSLSKKVNILTILFSKKIYKALYTFYKRRT